MEIDSNLFNSITMTLTELINEYIQRNPTRKEKEFLKTAYHINTKEKRGFTLHDFKIRNYTSNNYRQYRFKLSNIIYKIGNTNPAYYAIKGIDLPNKLQKITVGGMGVGVEALKQNLELIKYHPAKIHDIKIKFHSKNLHKILIRKGSKPHPTNNGIKLFYPLNQINSQAIILVYPKIVLINISNSFYPILYDHQSLLQLISILGEIRGFLHNEGHLISSIPDSLEWIITHYHFNKDMLGSEGKSGQITVGDFDNILTRYYRKKMPDGTVNDRLERIETPNITMKELMNNALDFGR